MEKEARGGALGKLTCMWEDGIFLGVKGMMRTLRSAVVEDTWGVKLNVEHVAWPWLVEYAGWLLTRAEVGKDGKIAYERNKG